MADDKYSRGYRNDPRDRGLAPYGATPARASGSAPASETARVSLSEAMQVPAFWLLVSSCFICGYTTGGLIGTHLIPHAVEHGFTEMVAAQALGVMGATSIFGSIASGWICDRFGRKGPLAWYYMLRGLSLLFLLSVSDVASLDLFAFILGLLPLVIAQGAGAITRHAVGTPVFGGMLAASLIGIFLIPALYVTAERLRRWRRLKK